MFAARSLELGDLIVTERPILVAPAACQARPHFPKHFNDEQKRQAILFEWEKTLDFAFSRASDKDKTLFRSLHNSHLEDGSGPLTGIIRTNGFGVGLQDKGVDTAHG